MPTETQPLLELLTTDTQVEPISLLLGMFVRPVTKPHILFPYLTSTALGQLTLYLVLFRFFFFFIYISNLTFFFLPLATFKVEFSPLTIGETSTVTISVTAAPRSEVTLILIANNLNFNPPHVTFHPTVTERTISVTAVHSDYKDANEIPFTVDYIISGTSANEFIPPVQTYLGVRQGGAPVVGGICGDASSVRAGIAIVLFSLLVAFMLQ